MPVLILVVRFRQLPKKLLISYIKKVFRRLMLKVWAKMIGFCLIMAMWWSICLQRKNVIITNLNICGVKQRRLIFLTGLLRNFD
ncbi:hypothetical protein OENOO_47003 [Oenococcus oeni ATCC BAA-1163]|uniref:Uncharacterized protein n=1 Tax=Oenococcus oeni ATCC BAA-1163 TaxID=379360 RepID=A0NIB0_OENOE|nr:hypothetical protein OENOO_47003 [Oenococcus oeni ATCC BAA-1163]